MILYPFVYDIRINITFIRGQKEMQTLNHFSIPKEKILTLNSSKLGWLKRQSETLPLIHEELAAAK